MSKTEVTTYEKNSKSKSEFPKSWRDLVGSTQTLRGNVFSHKKKIEPTRFEIIGLRWGSGVIMNLDTMKPIHPSIELLIQNNDMKKSRWTLGFPCREIKIKS